MAFMCFSPPLASVWLVRKSVASAFIWQQFPMHCSRVCQNSLEFVTLFQEFLNIQWHGEEGFSFQLRHLHRVRCSADSWWGGPCEGEDRVVQEVSDLTADLTPLNGAGKEGLGGQGLRPQPT